MKNARNFYVYEHWLTDVDECFYVGKGQGNRAWNMRSRSRYHKIIQEQVRRAGEVVEVRIIYDELDEQEAFRLEAERIAYWRERGVHLANFTDGGEGATGAKRSDETRRRLAESKRGKKRAPFSEEWRRKLGDATRGRKRSPEAVEKTAAAHRGRKRSQETCGKISAALTGRKMSLEARQKMSASRTGKPHICTKKRKLRPESVEKIRVRMLGNSYGKLNAGMKKSPEHVAKMSQKAKDWWAAKKAAGAA